MKTAEATPAEIERDPRRAVTMDRFLGAEPIREYLERAWKRRQLPQAILFTGPEGIGKTSLAYALMRRIAAGDGDPATEPHALKIERGVHPDVIELSGKDAVSGQIRIRDIEAMEERIYTTPTEAPLKMVLIDPADRMNWNSANTLLKVLEEPPPRLIFLLVTPEPNRILPTIRSRCSALDLQPVAREPLKRWLVERVKLTPEQADLAALLAEGRPGRALRLCEAGILGRRERLVEILQLLRAEGFAILFKSAESMLGIAGDLEETLFMAVALLRDALAIKVGAPGVLNVDLKEPLATLAGACSAEGLLESAQKIESASREARFFYTPQSKAHFVEMLLVDVGRLLRAG